MRPGCRDRTGLGTARAAAGITAASSATACSSAADRCTSTGTSSATTSIRAAGSATDSDLPTAAADTGTDFDPDAGTDADPDTGADADPHSADADTYSDSDTTAEVLIARGSVRQRPRKLELRSCAPSGMQNTRGCGTGELHLLLLAAG